MNILATYELALELHGGEIDKNGCPYIEHALRVFMRVLGGGGDLDQQRAALLHDVIEHGKTTADGLLEKGVPRSTVGLVLVLSRDPNQEYMAYISGIQQVPKAVPVKLADLDENTAPERVALLDEDQARSLAKRYRRAIELLRPAKEGMSGDMLKIQS